MSKFYDLPLKIEKRIISEDEERREKSTTVAAGKGRLSPVAKSVLSAAKKDPDELVRRLNVSSYKMKGSKKIDQIINFLKYAINVEVDPGEKYFKYLFDDPSARSSSEIRIPVAQYKTTDGKVIDANTASGRTCASFILSMLVAAASCSDPKISWNHRTDKANVKYSEGGRAVIVITIQE
jgi:hypothetical protein